MKTHVETVWTRNLMTLLCAAPLSLFLSGCGADGWPGSSKPLEASVKDKPANEKTPAKSAQEPQAESREPVPEPAAEVGQATLVEAGSTSTTAELLGEIEVALADTATTSRMDPVRDTVKRNAALRRQIDSGLAAAKALIAASPEDFEALATAWRARLTLLYRGASAGLEEYAEQLQPTAAAVAGTEFTEVAEYGNGLVLGVEYLDSDKPLHEVAEKLTEHARTYPDGKSSVRLFLAYAKKLARDNRPLDANSLCQAALWELHGHEELPYIHTFLKKLSEGETRKVESRKRDIIQKMIENQVAHVKTSLPLQIDELTILYEIEADYRMITYKYRVAVDLNEFRSEQRTIEEGVSRKARGAAMTRKLLDKGIRLKYMYFGKDGTPFHDFIVQKR